MSRLRWNSVPFPPRIPLLSASVHVACTPSATVVTFSFSHWIPPFFLVWRYICSRLSPYCSCAVWETNHVYVLFFLAENFDDPSFLPHFHPLGNNLKGLTPECGHYRATRGPAVSPLALPRRLISRRPFLWAIRKFGYQSAPSSFPLHYSGWPPRPALFYKPPVRCGRVICYERMLPARLPHSEH